MCPQLMTAMKLKLISCVGSFEYGDLKIPKTMFDLCEGRSTKGATKFDVFSEETEKYIKEDVGAAVDDRRYTTVTHLAKAISIRDF